MKTVNRKLDGLSIDFHRPYYQGWIIPKGFLVADPACHALMNYALQMKINLKEKNETIKYEETGDLAFNHTQLWKSTALSYGVEPEELLKYWANVDMQLTALGSWSIPEFYKMRSVPEVSTFEKPKILLPRKGDA